MTDTITGAPDQAPTMSWLGTLPVHPAANMFPMLDAKELVELGDDIVTHGMNSPIAMVYEPSKRGRHANYYLLDGRNRLAALEAVGIHITRDGRKIFAEGVKMPKSVIVDSRVTDPYEFVISANIHRRHLTAEQKRDLIAKLLKIDPARSDRKIGESVKADNKTVASVRKEMESREEIPHVERRKDSKGRTQPAQKSKRQKKRPSVMSLHEMVAAIDKEDEEVGRAYMAGEITGEQYHQFLDSPLGTAAPKSKQAQNPLALAWRGATEDERGEFVREFWSDFERYRSSRDAVRTLAQRVADRAEARSRQASGV